MKIRYVANACFLITLSNGERLLTDPWFDGPCHQTWWNFPPPSEALKSEVWASEPDFLYISHLHHDHLHAPTLAPFDRATPVIIGAMNTPNLRNGLRHLGFETLIETPFEARTPLGQTGAEFLLFKDFHGNTRGDETEIHYDLDTSIYIFDADGTRLFNAVDNTIQPLDGARIAAEYGAPDVAMLPYVSASLFPMAMRDYDDAAKRAATTALRARTRRNFRDTFQALSPQRVIPAGGEYVLGGPAAGQSRFLPQPLAAELAAELEGIGAGAALLKLYPGDEFDTDGGTVQCDARTAFRGFDDCEREAYALTLADQAPSYTTLSLPDELEFDWERALKRCAANYAGRLRKMGVTLTLDFYIDARNDDGEPALLFRQALDEGDCGIVSEVPQDARPRLVYTLDLKLLFCLVTGLLSWNATEVSTLIGVSRAPDEYWHDFHRSIVHFNLLS